MSTKITYRTCISGNHRRSLGWGWFWSGVLRVLGEELWFYRKGFVAEVLGRGILRGRHQTQERGGSTRVEHDVLGFKSGKAIDDCEYPQFKDSNKCSAYPLK